MLERVQQLVVPLLHLALDPRLLCGEVAVQRANALVQRIEPLLYQPASAATVVVHVLLETRRHRRSCSFGYRS
jgi:hypothetical protein